MLVEVIKTFSLLVPHFQLCFFQSNNRNIIRNDQNHIMTASFRCYVTNQRLSVLDYEEKKTNGRYRAVINEDKVAVIQLHHLQTFEAVSELSLCSGVLESNVLQLLSTSSIDCLVQLLIEKVDDNIIYR